ncbi:MAG: hypothetical protein WAZ12_01960 [Candidatus Absconditicoccaceae bacterium]
MKKIILLSLALVAGFFVVSNVTKAAPALLDLEITAVDGYCQYGADLDLLTHAQSYDAFTMSGNFVTASGADWFCNDTAGKAPRSMDISSTDLATSGATVYTIDKGQIEVNSSAYHHYYGDDTVFLGNAGDFATSYTALTAVGQVLFQKTSPAGTVGQLGVQTVDLRVLVPANQEIGAYQSTITIQVPVMTV